MTDSDERGVHDKHPCEDEKCAAFLLGTDDPYVCFHYHRYAEAIKYWGQVATGELSPDDVIPEYREFLDFDEAAATDQLIDHYECDNGRMQWTGPTIDIEIRVDHEPVNTITVHPIEGFDEMGYDTAMNYADGYAKGYVEALRDHTE